MSSTSLVRIGRATALAMFLACCGPQVASAVDFTLRNNTDSTSLRGDNYATHNQNIVWTSGGLFRSGDYQSWPNGSDNVVVQRSTDGGVHWQTLYDTGVHRDNLKPPTIEADAAGNIYILYPNSGGTRFVKFSPSNNYGSPVTNKLTTAASSASKFASAYDAGQDRLYHGTQWGRLLTYDNSGNVTRNQHLITDGGDSRPSYPHVMVDEFGVIHYAMTVADGGDDIPYTDIRYMKSLDGGQTWKAMDGTTVSIPTGASGSSGATLINRSSEHNYASWLANMYVKDGKVHFIYQTHNPWDPAGAGNPPPISPYMSYIRYDEATGTREIDRTTLEGNSYAINSEAASFASDTSNSTGALYVVGERSDGKRLQALVSYDNGQKWQDYAQSAYHGLIANPSLARSVTPDGKVIGDVALDDPYWGWVHYLELPTTQPTTTIAYWDGGGSYSSWNTSGNWVGDVAPSFDDKLAVAIGSASSTAKFDTMRIENNLTIRALIFGTYADADVNLRLHDSSSNGRTLTFASNVPGGSAEINVHHDATADIDIGGGGSSGDVVLNDPLRVNHNGQGTLTISRPVSGPHGITKSGVGEFVLSGVNANTFSGTTTVSAGKLVLGKSDGVNAIGGNLTIAPSSGWSGAANGVELAANEQIADSAVISFTGTDWSGFRLKGHSETVGGLDSPDGKGVIENSGQFQSVGDDGTLIVDTAGSSYTYKGYIRDLDGTDGGGNLNLVKTGLGTQTLTGNQIRYTGTTTVNGGTLTFSDTGNVDSSITNNATVEIAASSGDTWVLQNDKTLSGGGTWIKTGAGRATLQDTTVTVSGQIHVQQGTLRNNYNHSDWSGSTADMDISAGAILDLYADAIHVDALTGDGFVQNNFGNGSGQSGHAAYYEKLVVGVNDGTGTFSGVIRDNATGASPANGTAGGGVDLVKEGTGTQTLTGNNAYTGATTIAAGTLKLTNTYASPSFTINGGTLELNVASGARNYATTTFSGTGTLRKTGGGEAFWGSTAATFALGSGALIDVQAGTLTGGSFANENWTNNLADLNVASGATFKGVEANVRVDALTGGGTISSGFNGAGYQNFTFGVDNGSGTFDGVLADGSAPGNFVKSGSGMQTLVGHQTYTGTTTVNAGTLQVDGSIAASSMTTVAGGGVLGGNGAVGPLTLQGGTVAPGASVGSLSAGNTVWTNGSSLLFEIDDATGTAGAVGGPGWDLLDVAGTLDLSGLGSGGFTIDLHTLLAGGGANPGEMTSFLAGNDYSWEFVHTSGGILGAFESGDFLLDTSGVVNSFLGNFGIRKDGDSLFVTYSAASAAVPEPSTLVLLATGLLFVALCGWRKRP